MNRKKAHPSLLHKRWIGQTRHPRSWSKVLTWMWLMPYCIPSKKFLLNWYPQQSSHPPAFIFFHTLMVIFLCIYIHAAFEEGKPRFESGQSPFIVWLKTVFCRYMKPRNQRWATEHWGLQLVWWITSASSEVSYSHWIVRQRIEELLAINIVNIRQWEVNGKTYQLCCWK